MRKSWYRLWFRFWCIWVGGNSELAAQVGFHSNISHLNAHKLWLIGYDPQYIICRKLSIFETLLSMDQTAEFWIRKAIRPNGAEQCGNHIAARRYSSNDDSYQVRWHEFDPPHTSVYDKFSNYTEYVASVFEKEPFTGGGTIVHWHDDNQSRFFFWYSGQSSIFCKKRLLNK